MIRLLVLVAALLLAGVPASATVTVVTAVEAQTAPGGFLAAEHPHDTYWGGPASATVAETAAVVGQAPTTAAVVAQRATTGFLNAEHPHDTYWGGPASDKQLTDIGLTICAHHHRGLSDRAVLQAMMGGPEMLPPAGSEGERMGLQRVRNAVRYMCP